MVNTSDMPEWNIEITEILQKTVSQKAMTEQEAISVVKERYNREEIVLDVDCVVEQKFERVNTDELERMSCTQWGHDNETDNIEQLIANRKKTHYGIYADIGTALENVSNRDLIEFYINKYGDQTLRDLCESMIIRGEINKESSKVSQRQKQDKGITLISKV